MAPTPPPDDGTGDELDELSPDEEQRFRRFLKRERDAEQAAAARRKEPKDFGGFLDSIRAEVRGVLVDDFGLVPRNEREPDPDEAPARGSGTKLASKWFGGQRAAGD